jgi:Flp pilus assembly protein TadG
VEFAVVAPFFFLLVFLIFEGGLFMNAQVTLDNAAREGARALAICGSATTPTINTYQGVSTGTGCVGQANTAVYSHLGILNYVYPQNPQVNPRCPAANSCAQGNPVVVQTIYTYRFLIPGFLGLGPTATITSTAQEVSQQ